MLKHWIIVCLFFFSAQILTAQTDSLLLHAVKTNDIQQAQQALNQGANIGQLDEQGASLLMWAAYRSDLDMIRLLWKAGANLHQKGLLPTEKGGYYGNLTGIAAGEGKLDMLQFFLDSCGIEIEDQEYNKKTQQSDGWTALQWAISRKQDSCITYLLDRGANANVAYSELADYYSKKGLYAPALKYAQLALEHAIFQYGKDHPKYGEKLNNLGNIHSEIGNYDEALSYLQMAREAAAASLGTDHQDYASVLGNLGSLLQQLGRFDEALVLMKEGAAIKKQVYGQDHPAYGVQINNLGLLYKDMGKYDLAIPNLQTALGIAEQVLGQQHPYYVNMLSNLGAVYMDLGQYEQAYPLFKQTQAITAQTFGKEHFRYASGLHVLGILYKSIGQYDSAIAVFEEALTIEEKTFGKEHERYDNTLASLANVYLWSGTYDKALLAYKESLRITEKTLGKDHYSYGYTLGSLGHVYALTGRHDSALMVYQQSLTIMEKAAGKGAPGYQSVLTDLARHYQRMRNPQAAIPVYTEVFELLTKELNQGFNALSDRSQHSFLQTKSSTFNYLSSFWYYQSSSPIMRAVGFNQQLLLKGFLQNNRKDLLQGIQTHPDSNIQQQYAAWKDLHRSISDEYQKAPSKRSKSIDSLRNELDKLEFSLADQSRAFRKAHQSLTWQDVQATLSDQEVIIEFAQVNLRLGQVKKADSTMYVAFILRPGDSSPEMIPLFEERDMETLLRYAQEENRFKELYANRGISPKKGAPKDLGTLTELLWSPIQAYMKDAKTIYFSPVGLLHRINLGAIPIQNGELLSDRFQLIQLGSSRSLVFNAAEDDHRTNQTAMLLGGINFNKSSSDAEQMLVEEENASSEELMATRNADGLWNYLAGTEKEVSSIGSLLQGKGYEVELMTGNEAEERRISSQESSPRILHLATHGYFFPDPYQFPPTVDDPSKLPPVQLSDNPMVRSGLILTGANHAWAGNTVPEGEEDGILTAYEISRMDLSNTELVVLSACETGLGDIQGNEGVYGLQRAFKIAGAKYILMSLWQVPDQATQELMTAFYEKWLGGMEIRKALQKAQKEMRKKYQEPFYWAGFVLVE